MPSEVDWIPMRWPDGWTDPSRLQLIEGTPVNCLVVTDAAPPFIEAAAKRGLNLVSLEPRPGTTHIPCKPLDKVDWTSAGKIQAIAGGVWPGTRLNAEKKPDTVEAGPTGAPWVDSNTWLCQLARTLAVGKAVWTTFDPPANSALRAEDYQLAVTDGGALGAKWVLSLDAALTAGIGSGNAGALQDWKAIVSALQARCRNPLPASYGAVGSVGVVSDFSGENEFMATEVLNLGTRRNLFYEVILKSKVTAARLQSLPAVLYVDAQPADAKLIAILRGYVEAGGLLLAPKTTASLLPGTSRVESPMAGYSMVAVGKGRVATPDTEWDDPFILAEQTHLLISHRHDPVMLWNCFSVGACYLVAPDRRKAVVQLMNYSGRAPANNVTIGLKAAYATASFWSIEHPEPLMIKPVRVKRGIEVPLPRFSIYGQLELEVSRG